MMGSFLVWVVHTFEIFMNPPRSENFRQKFQGFPSAVNSCKFKGLFIRTPKLTFFSQKAMLAANALLTLHVYTRLTQQSAYSLEQPLPVRLIYDTPGWETRASLSMHAIFTIVVGVTCSDF